MNNELTIPIGDKKYKVFLNSGFYVSPEHVSYYRIHKHRYAEVHLICGGNATYNISNNENDTVHSTVDGNLFLIPAGIYHNCIHKDQSASRTAFQIECDIDTFSAHKVDENIVQEFFKEIKKCGKSGDHTKLSAYIVLFFSNFLNSAVSVRSITDYGYLVNEFFSDKYGEDLRLPDLAKSLHLSERQTERLMIEHTGHTFKQELLSLRMKIANRLLNKSEMPLSEIAQYVGYHSYAGYWKAMKKHKKDEAK